MSLTKIQEFFYLDYIPSEVWETAIVGAFFLITFGAICLAVEATIWGATAAYQRFSSGTARNPQLKGFESMNSVGLPEQPPAKIEKNDCDPKPKPQVHSYSLDERIATGDVCEVFRATRRGQDFVLKMPRALVGTGLLAKESLVLEQLHEAAGDESYREYFPREVDSFEVDRRRVNVFDSRDGFLSAEQIREKYSDGLDGRHIAWMFKRTLVAIGFAHNHNWIHGAVLPPHLMFHTEGHGLQLVDWTHAEQPGKALTFVPAEFKDWYPPECHDRSGVTPSVDIWLAAKSMIWLAGGDPILNKMPDHLPAKIRRFLSGCLLESASMRCQDAWQLHDEFTELLESVYGAPRYHRLVV